MPSDPQNQAQVESAAAFSLREISDMSTSAESFTEIKKPWLWVVAIGGFLLIWGAVSVPSLMRARTSAFALQATRSGPLPARTESLEAFHTAPASPKSAIVAQGGEADAAVPKTKSVAPDASAGRKLIRTGSMEMVVQHPSEVADRLTALAERMGGYLVSSEGGGQTATAETLTIRVPAARFEEARAEIRKLGLRLENEKIDAQDVTRQYVDQDASLRNLHAEEMQYLSILKQASTVKDMLLVSERLSEVRGQIEQQQAEFNALAQQIDTVALTISLRTEAEAEVFGLNWRPGYQLKLALRDGLESLATYATSMLAFLVYLPSVLLWVGTMLAGMVITWRVVRWTGRRWFGWTQATPR